MKVKVTTDIYPEKLFEGTVYKIYPTIDAATRTFKTEIIIENPEEILRPGMYANMEIKLGDIKSFAVPAIAILKQEGTNNRFVFLNDNGIAKKIDIIIGKRFDDLVEIKNSNIKAGSELIIEGQVNLLNGSKINVVNE